MQLSVFAAVKKKTSKVPVFLIYAGIIHAIGLALLMPMLITLPGPGGSVDRRRCPPRSTSRLSRASPLAAKIESDSEQTSALPSAEAAEGAGSQGRRRGARPSPMSVPMLRPRRQRTLPRPSLQPRR